MLEYLRTSVGLSGCRRAAARALRRFARQQAGTSAVEFGLIAAPFLALVFAIMETAVIFFSGQALETAVADSARLIMTGQAQNQALNQSTFKDAVCARIYGLFNCAGGIQVDVRTYTSFGSITYTPPLDTNGNLVTSNFVYQPGGPGDIVVVRLYYAWPIYVSLMNLNRLANMSGNNRLLVATAAFRNEPYN